jgi:tetratricopeptide (TPR) repeat protein
MRRCAYSFGWLLLLALMAVAQPEIRRLESAWKEDRLSEIKQALPNAVLKYPNHPTVLFFQAVINPDAEEAAKIYRRLYSEFKTNEWADDALFRAAHYRYARGRYLEARKLYSLLLKSYGQSDWRDDARYLAAQSYWAEGKTDSAQWMFGQLIKDSPRSAMSDLAVQDLEANSWKAAPEKPRPQTPAAKTEYFAIQVGAFAVHDNALSILKGLEKVGYKGEIVEKQIGSRTFWAVWIGQFPDREAAVQYARRFIVKLTKEYQVVEKKNKAGTS